MNGTVFDIKEFSIHDGPGGRVTVFLKGCPLRCVWCHNPEGLSPHPEIVFKENLCVKCQKCLKGCNHDECKGFDRCIHACANGAISVAGALYQDDALAKKINGYKDFFKISGGGVTFSGGEPLMQGEFVISVAEKLNGIHTAIQTSGYADNELYKKAVLHMDYIMQDIKIANSVMHKKYTGVSNDMILENIDFLKKSGKQFVFRVPLIPGITDTEANLTEISKLTEDFPVELLKYNTLAGAKYKSVGRNYTLSDKPNKNTDFTKYFSNAKIV